MYAITLTQPWATLVAIGAKRFETRSWGTHHRGPLAIHAGAGLADYTKRELVELCQAAPFADALAAGGYQGFADLPRGAIVAVGQLRSCIHLEDYLLPPGGAPRERIFGNYAPGRYAWILEHVRALPEPIPARGALGLWTWAPASAPVCGCCACDLDPGEVGRCETCVFCACDPAQSRVYCRMITRPRCKCQFEDALECAQFRADTDETTIPPCACRCHQEARAT